MGFSKDGLSIGGTLKAKWSPVKIWGLIKSKTVEDNKPKIPRRRKTILKPKIEASIPPEAPAKAAAKPIPVLSILQENASLPLSTCLVKRAYQVGTTQAMAKPLKHSKTKMCQG